ncbi:3-methyl-2-oxobutanoate hydroxymethyltransferase [Corynebacterium pelargi]|uniref:3-methyl-2-oxobutanoate hydroxymethyltransferase n=1 Tax=Corynebacterium pelargi TaxID=1471400 RepID=A0A410WBX3_9CORY|nr:3-methyl-2-oxobutanoate hydroxymethyltransferase [Corynebacterium pelargi]QAU53434.1 3-methyl-2-oxobutanoate hydroxymethyltransferase [Corynebacterium pelargi]GGG82050.1 3-methyl-2-oxobutanoate hydroxymethyltransferase [Corynebacterium pelargi]
MSVYGNNQQFSPKRLRIRHIQAMKDEGRPISALTSYDALSASIFAQAGIDILLVGDSAANVVFGRPSTLSMSMNEMAMLGRAVADAAPRPLVVVDLPFGSYEVSCQQGVQSAIELMKATGADAIKLEGERPELIRAIVEAGIPVMAHLGFTPQSEHALGGFVVQGKGEARETLFEAARRVEEAGAFAVVLEMVPQEIAGEISSALRIPTIGIGAGNATDGQILVWTDAFGLGQGRAPRFVRRFADVASVLDQAAREYIQEVHARTFPAEAESFSDPKED